MKLLVLAIVLLAMCFELNARCVRHHSGDGECSSIRVFPEPEPRNIHYIYHGESCDCPRYHDVIVQKPEFKEKTEMPRDYEFKVAAMEVKPQKEQDESYVRYLFDVHVEKPVEMSHQKSHSTYDYKLQKPEEKPAAEQKNSIRYIYDTRVEKPIKSCTEDQKYHGLVAQVDKISMPHRGGCQNPHHTPESCNCGCRDASHTPSTCDCHKNIYNYSQNEAITRIKRDAETKKILKKLHRHELELKLPKMKKIEPKDLSKLLKLEKPKKRPALAKPKAKSSAPRPKRREGSPCAYTYESCDPNRKTPAGCPLCYKCKCEPAEEHDNQHFSARDIRIPYRIAEDGEMLAAPSHQEFDYEPASYTGLDRPDMYRQYIEQIISKYPEHMARRMPNLMDQQRDLMNFIAELARNDRSPQGGFENNDVRYKMLDNAVELYKMYENAIGQKRRLMPNGKMFTKRGTLIEIVEDAGEDASA